MRTCLRARRARLLSSCQTRRRRCSVLSLREDQAHDHTYWREDTRYFTHTSHRQQLNRRLANFSQLAVPRQAAPSLSGSASHILRELLAKIAGTPAPWSAISSLGVVGAPRGRPRHHGGHRGGVSERGASGSPGAELAEAQWIPRSRRRGTTTGLPQPRLRPRVEQGAVCMGSM